MILASNILPLWEDIWLDFFVPTLMAGSLVAWILSGRRWNSYAFWFVMALCMIQYGGLVIESGWKEVLPRYPYQYTYTPDGGIGLSFSDSGYNYRWRMHFVARLFDWTIVFLSLSAPFWRKWARRKLGLREYRFVPVSSGDVPPESSSPSRTPPAT